MESRMARHRTKQKKPWYKQSWVWIVLGTLFLFIVGSMYFGKDPIFLQVDKAQAVIKSDKGVDITFKTNSGNSYRIINLSSGRTELKSKTSTGHEGITIYNPGKYKLVVNNGDLKKSRILTVTESNASSVSTSKEDSSNVDQKDTSEEDGNSKPEKKELSFGTSTFFYDGDAIAEVKVNSVQTVDPNYDMVTDISHNYSGMEQYVVVNYTVSALKGDVDLDDFDGSELAVADSNGTIGTASSNRDPGSPDSLSEGQNADLRIGIGLKHTGNDVTVSLLKTMWRGQITQ